MDGTIKKIYLKNFVTYDELECLPCKNLNVIIGPNGTGKSTIVSAIMLGLGEKPVLTGRGRKPEEFIKTGCQEAKIVLGLNPNHEVERIIDADGKSAYRLNGMEVSEKDVNNFTKSLNIQVGNLCQFLPQDRVSEFARMNKTELLINTEKAVGGEKLIKLHNKLIEKQTQAEDLEDELSELEKSLATKIEQNERLDVDVRTITEKNNLLVEIGNCKKKMLWMEYEAAANETAEAKDDRILKETAFNEAIAAFQPISKEKDELELKQKQIKEKRGKTAKSHDLLEATIRAQMEDVTDTSSKIKNLEYKCKRNAAKDEARIKQIRSLKQSVEELARIIAKIEAALPETKIRIKGITEFLEEHGKKISELEQSISQVRLKSSHVNYQKDVLKASILKAENVQSRKLDLLSRINKDAYKGAIWLLKNRHLFQGRVYLPLMVELDVTDPKCASYVENAIGHNDLIAFSCENNFDVNFLANELRMKQRLKVNIFSTDVRLYMKIPPCTVEELKVYGFDGYLDQFINVPEPIRRYLKLSKKLHTVPVSHKEISMDVKLPFNRYYTEGSVVFVSKSIYTSEILTTISKVRNAICLQISQDTSKTASDKDRLRQLEKQCQSLDNQLCSYVKEKENYMEICEQKRDERNTVQQIFRDLNTAKLAYTRKQNEIRDIDRERHEYHADRNALLKKINELVREAVMKQLSTAALLENIQKVSRDGKMLKIEGLVVKKKLAAIEKASKQYENDIKNAEAALDTARANHTALKNHAKECFRVAKTETEGISPFADEFAKYYQIFATLPATVSEVEKLIDEKRALVKCKKKVPNYILVEYQKRNKEIARLERQIKSKEDEIALIKSTIATHSEKWLCSLRSLVAQISHNFRKYFKEIYCAGDVVLETGSNEHDYKNYGLSIKVSFRESEPIRELDEFTQSGGERGVATALYMISLQELTKVPFRCVDEINQGMDETNERRVYRLLMSITSKEGTSQYFLLTPKLIRGIKYSKNCKLHCVFNGPGVLSYNEWDVDAFIERKKRKMDTD